MRVPTISRDSSITREKKKTARVLARKALKLGVIPIKTNCEGCGKPFDILEMHHQDYSKPLEVFQLCRICHFKEHGWCVKNTY